MCPKLVEHDDEEVDELYFQQKLDSEQFKPKIELSELNMFQHMEMFKNF